MPQHVGIVGLMIRGMIVGICGEENCSGWCKSEYRSTGTNLFVIAPADKFQPKLNHANTITL